MVLKNIKRKTWIQFLSAIAVCGILLSAVISSAYARYENNISQAVRMQYKNANGHIYFRNVENDETDRKQDGGFTSEFILSNGTKEEYSPYDQLASISIVATIGIGNPEECTMTLIDGTISYQAVYSEIMEGTKLHSEYGPGWVYHFYDETGEEIAWRFSGKCWMERPMKIVVNGASQAPAVINLIVETKTEG